MAADHKAFLIRTAKPADAEMLSVMMIKSWRESYVQIISPTKLDAICSLWLNPSKFHERLCDDNACNLVAECSGELVGHAHVLPRENDSVLVAYLYVLQNHARRGIGQTLLKSAIDCFPGTEHVELGVFEDNHAAIAFYKAVGFFEAGPEPTQPDEPTSIKMTMAI
ncbi:GNAT family N-acetyltransferase [Maritalea sp.]|uniref:GNAT family N-acetyltransferase n=1 Tax=Maritalea sp. TaxID=2003361 RepID=UPI003EF21539